MGDDKDRFQNEDNGKGPVAERGCTDILCFIIFVLGSIAMLVIASLGWSNGNPTALTSVFDSSGKCCGNVCGKYPEMENYKYLYITIPSIDNALYHTTCVEECPGEEIVTKAKNGQSDALKCNLQDNRNVTTCAHNCDAAAMFYDYSTYMTVQEYTGNKLDPKTYLPTQTCLYETKKFLKRICFPSSVFFDSLKEKAAEYRKALEEKVNTEALQEYVNSMVEGWPIVLASVFISIVIGFLYMYFVKLCAGIIIWLSILAYHLVLLLLATFCLTRANYYKDLDPPETDNYNNLRIVGFTMYGLFGVSVIVICCFFNKIQLAVQIIKAAADYVNDVKTTLLIPPLFGMVTAFYWFVWIIGFIYIYSWGDVEKAPGSVIGTIKWPEGNDVYVWYYLFQGLWTNAFIQACCQFVLVSAPCMWYFVQPNSENLHNPVTTSLWRLVRYHTGSLAFGSLLVAIIQFIRVILAYIDQQAKQTGWSDQQPMKCILKYLQCIAACFERFIKFINKNAYIQIAMHGTNFCASAREAMRIIWNNASRATVINGVGGIFIYIGQFLISMFTVMLCYQILVNVSPFNEYSPFLPCVFIFIISYTISVLFLSVYGSGIDAIFLCFCVDEEQARGKGMEMPEHCPAELQDFFEKRVNPKAEMIRAKTVKPEEQQ